MEPRKGNDWRLQKKIVYITDRITAKRAKTYVYGHKEAKRVAAVFDMNLYIDECMTCVPPEPAPITITAASNSYLLTFALMCMSVFVLYAVSRLVFYYRV